MKKKHIAFAITLSLITLLSFPATVAYEGLFSSPVFDESYFGALSPMVKKLEETKGKKMVIIGNSSVAFGIRSALLQQELNHSDIDYSIVNFGLYGSIGTKTMMDLSRKRIHEGDIVIFSPELMEGTLSTYFSGESYLRACDGHLDLLWETPEEEREKVVGSFYDFAASKASYQQKGMKADSKDVYMLSSFDENLDLTLYERKNNIMESGYDRNNTIDFSSLTFSKEFTSLVLSYVQYVQNQKAEIYFAFGPMNEKCVLNASQENLVRFRDMIQEQWKMKVINSPYDSILDYRYFYDTNFHLNDTGMLYHTLKWAEMLKNHFGKNDPLSQDYPEPPSSDPHEEGEGDNQDLDCFEYTLEGDLYRISGLTEKGKERKEILLPYSYEDKRIYTFDASVFQGNPNIEKITLQENITFLYDYCFSSSNISSIYLRQEDPKKTVVGYHLLDGSKASIFVKEESFNAYLSNYTWSFYGKSIQSY